MVQSYLLQVAFLWVCWMRMLGRVVGVVCRYSCRCLAQAGLCSHCGFCGHALCCQQWWLASTAGVWTGHDELMCSTPAVCVPCLCSLAVVPGVHAPVDHVYAGNALSRHVSQFG